MISNKIKSQGSEQKGEQNLTLKRKLQEIVLNQNHMYHIEMNLFVNYKNCEY